MPGDVVARCDGALARATRDGAVWIGHVREERDKALKLPATHVFATESAAPPAVPGYAPIRYEEDGPVGLLHFAILQRRDEHRSVRGAQSRLCGGATPADQGAPPDGRT